MLRSACVLAGVSLALVAAGGGAAAKSNGKIVFSAGTAPPGGGMITSQVYVANADGSGRVKLTSGSSNQHPTFSPDGTQIAFTSDRAGDYDLYVMGADGSNQTAVATAVHGIGGLAWSPNGSTIAFTRTQGDTSDIWVVAAAGGGAKLAQANAIAPAWSADGKKLAFYGDSDNRLYWSSGAAGSRHRVIAHSGLPYEQAPSWSPDGKTLVFTGDVADHPQVWIVGVDGSGLRKLTSTAKDATYPVFSPDGTKIVYGDGGKLIELGTDGTGARVLSTVAGEITGISWAAGTAGGAGTGASTGKNPHHCTIDGARTGRTFTVGTFTWWLIQGTPGDDVICGTAKADYILGGGGDDVVYGGAGNDALNGQAGNDKLYGEAGDDTINDREGGDVLNGGPGNDRLLAVDVPTARGADSLAGSGGDDTLCTKDDATDALDGGAGADTAVTDDGIDSVVGVEMLNAAGATC